MENQNEVVSVRHENMNMLAILLEKVKEYDGMVAAARKKKADIDEVDRQLAIPQKKIPLVWKIIGIIVIVIGWITLLVKWLRNRKEYKLRQAELSELRQRLQAEYEDMCAKIKQYETDVLNPSIAEYVPDRFPMRYAHSAYAIEFMLNLMTDLRADTIKEAINLYEQEMHCARIEKALRGIFEGTWATVQNTARAALAQEATARNTAVMAAASTATAVNTAATAAHTASMAGSLADIADAERQAADAISRW